MEKSALAARVALPSGTTRCRASFSSHTAQRPPVAMANSSRSRPIVEPGLRPDLRGQAVSYAIGLRIDEGLVTALDQ